ncbi:unnamed protein product [Malus baccata var. baccata]
MKNSLIFDPATSKKLVKWKNGSDYRSWDGVSCKKGCVSNLDLSSEEITGGLDNSSSFFRLKSIENLNLAYNFFNYIQIPSEFKQLTSLSNLNLSNAGFAGQVPIEISHLTRLVTLDLSTFYLPGIPSLNVENPKLNVLLRNFSELVELYLDGPIHISLLKLKSLSVILIDSNNLSTQVPEFFSNFPNLTSLQIMNSGLYGAFPKNIFQVPTLQTFDLSGNPQLQGSLPEFPKNGSLRSLVLNGANFSGQMLPNSIGNLKLLSKIDIGNCNFTGSIPKSMEDLTQLVYLDLSMNKFNGSVPSFSMAKNLTVIDVSYNQLTGQINSSLWENLTSLVNLDLRHNLLNGTIPPSVFSLPTLQKLQLSNNEFSGQLLEFDAISVLDTLDLSSNKLEGPIPKSILKFRGLKILLLSSNNFTGSFLLNDIQQLRNLSSLDLSFNSLSINYNDTNSSHSLFPNITTLKLVSGNLRRILSFLRNQSKLSTLDLSQNQIHGEIPNWIWRLSNLVQLNLSCNSLETLEGHFLNLTSTLSVLDRHSNQLQGQIPMLPGLATYLDYSRNNFSSGIPTDIGDFIFFTEFFSLSSNHFHGIIPESVCKAPYLQVLDLSNNSLSGRIPQCLTEISRTLAILNLWRNKLDGSVPDRFPQSCSLKTLDLNGNQIAAMMADEAKINHIRFQVLQFSQEYYQDAIKVTTKGLEMELVKILTVFTSIDFSCNNFNGSIPEEVGKLKSLHGLNLSSNDFTGTIPSSLSNLRQLESLDLSDNKLSGEIPQELVKLNFLSFLNLSINQLEGRIPTGTQIHSFSAASFAFNKGLWGPPLTVDITSRLPPPPPLEKGHSNAQPEIDFDLISTEINCIFSFGAVIGPLVFCKRWRKCYYITVENIFFKVFPQLEERIRPHRRHVHITQRPRRRNYYED